MQRSRKFLAGVTLLLTPVLAGCGGGHAPAPRSSTPRSGTPTSGTPTSRTASAAAVPSSTSARPVTAASVVSVPVQVATTADGAVGYRSVGRGPTVLLVMGFGGTLNNWPPSFVAALARTHRVITFDNAGIGKTSALPAPLTITAMAGQTAALLLSLKTGPVGVLGWSMGGMIAQALAVQRPGLVSHLVLAATLPGDGTATSPGAAVQRELASSVTNPAAALPLLFPATASAASNAYVAGVLSWPGYHSPSPGAATEQVAALRSWVTGAEPAGRNIKAIAAPTLIADGSQDVLVPPANLAALGAAIAGSRKLAYPGAGHAFLFQDQARFLATITAYLG